ncbi:SDR family NAD(P)-dependent oxidoreductase [Motilimonas eburnea]|uniref:SDR family NAD(P)-dependent oxidoreductase n=1 Tax=Motilimonas eburnea TaxID=1737488 RepID=UPI001E38E605|nr:SDR family NAD(P)-dependent oxidoreductase [Motilimonas eburnea]MCE2570353.1 SDR family oxidoreductase [Motilimonas eburnea]
MKQVLITGAGQGIGKAMALTFAEHGYHVFINVRRNTQEVDKLLGEIQRLGGSASLALFDINDATQRRQFAQRCDKLDVLINNAGVLKDNLLVNTPLTDWQQIITTNFQSACALFEQLKTPLLAGEAGTVINLASIAGVRPRAGQNAYSVSKRMIIAWTEQLANAYPSLRCYSISPGPVATEMIKASPWYQQPNAHKRIPMRRFCQPEEIAQVALSLANQAMFRSGSNLVLDGGFSQTLQVA